MTWAVRGDQLIYRRPAAVDVIVSAPLKPPPALASASERALPAPRRIRVRDVQIAAAAVCGVPLSAMTSAARIGPWVRARHLAMRVAIDITGRPVNYVALCFCRDHTTVLHALRVTADEDCRALCDRIAAEAAISAARFERSCREPAQANWPDTTPGGRLPGGQSPGELKTVLA